MNKPFVSFEGPNINPNPHPRLSKFNCFNSRHMLLAVMKTGVYVRLIHFRKTNSQKRDIMSYFGEFSVVTDSSFKEYKGGVIRQTFVSFEYSPVCHFSVQTDLYYDDHPCGTNWPLNTDFEKPNSV